MFKLIIISLYTYSVSCECNKNSFTYDITDGTRVGSLITKDKVTYDPTDYFIDNNKIFGCVCELRTCIRKCCSQGKSPQRVEDSRECLHDPLSHRYSIHDLNEITSSYEIIHFTDLCPDRNKISLVVKDFNYKSDILNGIFNVQFLDKRFDYKNFCLDFIGNELFSIICIDVDSESSVLLMILGMIISMPFLLATFVAYALLPDRNLHMKALMCYVFNLFHAYLFLVTIQLTPEIIGEPWCTIIGYSCIYFFLASFFWMNVICIDIFLGFRGFKGGPGMRSFEYKRFYYYCLYAWGMSFLIVLLTYFCNTQGTVDDWWYPAVSKGQCFVRNGLPQLIFFYGPMGIIILTNIILFSLTAYRIRQVKKDTKMLKHAESKRHSEDDQQKFKLYLKLLLAMGVNWSMEIISWGVNFKEQEIPPYIWYLTDFCNATYGVFIFFIFVFKKNIWKQLKRRYYAFTGRQYLAHSMATTNHTKTTNYSVSTSTNEQRCEENEL